MAVEAFNYMINKSTVAPLGSKTYAITIEYDTGKYACISGVAANIEVKTFELSADKLSVSIINPVYLTAGSGPTYIQAVKIATNKILIVYKNGSSELYGVVASISAGVVTFGTHVQISSLCYTTLGISQLTTDKAIVNYKGSSNYGFAAAISVSGTTITAGTPYQYVAVAQSPAAANSAQRISAISATQALVIYRDTNIKAMVLDISGTTVTGNTAADSGYGVDYFALGAISSTKFIMAYHSTSKTVRFITVSGTTPTFGTAVYSGASDSAASLNMRIHVLTTSLALYTGYTGSPHLLVDISGATPIILDSDYVGDAGDDGHEIIYKSSTLAISVTDAGLFYSFGIDGSTLAEAKGRETVAAPTTGETYEISSIYGILTGVYLYLDGKSIASSASINQSVLKLNNCPMIIKANQTLSIATSYVGTTVFGIKRT